MAFFSNPKPSTPVYIYEAPFVIPKETHDYEPFIEVTESATYQTILEAIHAQIVAFAVTNEVIVEVEGRYQWADSTNMASFVWAMMWKNMRSLVHPGEMGSLLISLTANDHAVESSLIDLHVRLGILYPKDVLNYLVNRTFSTISIIPYGVPDDFTPNTWEEIHRMTPFVWLVIYAQALLRSMITVPGN